MTNTIFSLIKRLIARDAAMLILLVVLCWLFYWRLLTPNSLNQQSLVEGDFSGQFVPFAHYQAVRFSQGEVPLWNPDNYGGHPFLADTQSAVFYPPRLITIGLLNVTGGSTPQRMYDALQKEMIAHVLIASWLMYLLMRRLTKNQPYSIVASLISALTFAYGGYLTGYPQLQLAVMEAGVWLPLALLGIHEATNNSHLLTPTPHNDGKGEIQGKGVIPSLFWFTLSGIALALSFSAGHSQTTLFFIYCTLAYLAWRVVTLKLPWWLLIGGAAIFGLIGAGLAAIQLLPAWEYLGQTTRNTLGFDALANGFPFYDLVQMILPGILSLWSPLYIGVVGLALALYGGMQRDFNRFFWIGIAGIALLLSFGHGTIVYDLFYNVIPGFALFREQERSAYLVTMALSIFAGYGAIAFLRDTPAVSRLYNLYNKIVRGTVIVISILGGALFLNWLTIPNSDSKRLGLVAFSMLMALLAVFVLTVWRNTKWRPYVVVGLVIFELFSFGRFNPNLEPKPTDTRLPTPALVKTVQDDHDGIFRVDGVGQNYGTLYGVADIQGISPLRPANIDRLLSLPPERIGRVWEALAVRYVLTPNTALPVPSTIVSKEKTGNANPINLHKLTTPRPFARLVYKTWIEPDANAAIGILSEPSFDAANTVILETDPALTAPATLPNNGKVEITRFAPETIVLQTTTSIPAILDLALVNYPGWGATLDGQPTPILRADTALSAVVVSAGIHTVQFRYQPRSYIIGANISIGTLVLTILLLVVGGRFVYRKYRDQRRIAAATNH